MMSAATLETTKEITLPTNGNLLFIEDTNGRIFSVTQHQVEKFHLVRGQEVKGKVKTVAGTFSYTCQVTPHIKKGFKAGSLSLEKLPRNLKKEIKTRIRQYFKYKTEIIPEPIDKILTYKGNEFLLIITLEPA